ncbi:MAG: hypothetical protein R2712_10565 [Vicinamibacterales bacterium]
MNDDEMVDLLEFVPAPGARSSASSSMDVGGATAWSLSQVVPRAEMLTRLEARMVPSRPLPKKVRRRPIASGFPTAAPSIIASTTAPFCSACDRSRPTADGLWYLCLYAARGIDPREGRPRRCRAWML